MLEQAILGKPPTKFVLIQDNYETRQVTLVNSILKMQRNRNPTIPINIFKFENGIISSDSYTKYYNMLSDPTNSKFLPIETENDTESIIIIDSLADLIYIHGLASCLQELKKLSDNKNIIQIITVLHTDLFEDCQQISKYFAFLSTLDIIAHDFNILECTHKRPFGKVVKKTLNVVFENGGTKFSTKEVDLSEIKLSELRISDDVKVDVVKPENLSTFKIGLEENEIESRNKLVLPYIRKAEGKGKPLISIGGSVSGSKILYLPDDNDDFDEEDPDDDLDI